MAEFRTSEKIAKSEVLIDHHHSILAMGSCFAVHMAEQLEQAKFRVLSNPFGILYNPISIAKALSILKSGEALPPEVLFQHEGLWHSFLHHGAFSGVDRQQTLSHINQTLKRASEFLKQTDWMILTLGTAHVFIDKASRAVVANCHKLPGQRFVRRRLELDETVEGLSKILVELKASNKDLEVVLTVSPVRHLRDGLVENQRSKACLLLASEMICRELDFVHYFPAYELMMDDLRDYRFYADDLIHPNKQAVKYIWDQFQSSYFSESTRELCRKVLAVLKARQHRLLHPNTKSVQLFARDQLSKIEQLEIIFDYLDWAEERKYFQNLLQP